MIRSTICLAAICLVTAGQEAEAASSIEEALTEIAGSIVAELPPDSNPTIAISTFTHSGNSCSALSTYASEMMLPVLQSAGQGKINIIARSQLSALFREAKLVYDGTISPNAAQQIGQVSGVEAILAATILPFGEQVMIISTLIGTADGAVLGSANAQFPVTETVRSQLETQSVTLCGFSPSTTIESVKVETAAAPAAATGTIGAASSRPSPSGHTLFETDVFSAQIMALTYSKSTGETRWSIRFSNTSDRPIGLSYLDGTSVASDNEGGTLTWGGEWAGLRRCGNENWKCTPAERPDSANILEPGRFAQLNFNYNGLADLTDPLFTITFDLFLTPDAKNRDGFERVSVGFYDIQPTTK